MDFRTRLVSELTAMDERDSRRPGHNRYAIGMYLEAADGVAEEIAAGETPEGAFAEFFTPSRAMHGVARRCGLRLDVDRGRWVELTAAGKEA